MAAHNVFGATLHTLFHLPINRESYSPLEGPSATNFSDTFLNTRFIIIDEHSMISAQQLSFIEKRLHELRPKAKDKLFAGFYVYFFGDVRQLIPVAAQPMYLSPDKSTDPDILHGISVFRSFDYYYKLSTSQRQRNDNSFFDFLNNLGDGSISPQYYSLPARRRESALTVDDKKSFEKAIHLFQKNDDVNHHNDRVLERFHQPVARILKISDNDCDISTKDDFVAGLPNDLKLTINVRVMLRRNLNTKAGLVNGSLGTVRHIVYQGNKVPPAHPEYILVEFDDYPGPYFYDKCFPILPYHYKGQNSKMSVSQIQFPVSVAHAITIHKSQGLTLDKAVIDIGDRERAAGASYVALSRLRNFSDLMLQSIHSLQRWDITHLETHKRKMAALVFIDDRCLLRPLP